MKLTLIKLQAFCHAILEIVNFLFINRIHASCSMHAIIVNFPIVFYCLLSSLERIKVLSLKISFLARFFFLIEAINSCLAEIHSRPNLFPTSLIHHNGDELKWAIKCLKCFTFRSSLLIFNDLEFFPRSWV